MNTDRKADTIGAKAQLEGAEPQTCRGGSLAETEADPGVPPSSSASSRRGRRPSVAFMRGGGYDA